MREKNRNSIEKCRKKLPQFTTMNVIDGQAGLTSYSSLIFYSLTIDNILNIIVLLILAGVTISAITGDDGTITNASKAKFRTEIRDIEEKIELEEINHNNGEEFQFGSLEKLIGRTDGYNEILSMEDGKLVYDPEKVSDKQKGWLEEMDIQARQDIIPIYTAEQLKKIRKW